MLNQRQWSFLRFWIFAIIIAEIIMFFLREHLPFIYLLISFLFLLGFILRKFNLYPGYKEPLILDFLGFMIGMTFYYFSLVNKNYFLLIFLSPTIVFPHIIYIVKKKDI